MNASQEYIFTDFTFTNYKKLLLIAQKKYKFKLFTDDFENGDKIIILRHDLEFSVPHALRMAQIEYDLGIRSTYFVQIHSEFYNILDESNYQSIKVIMEMGHEIGLHFDTHFWNINSENLLGKYIKLDKSTLERYFDIKIRAFSFHNTNQFTLRCEKEYYAGLINVYSRKYKMEVGYCSDSTGYWRYERLEDRLRAAKDLSLQILTHDAMWQDKVLSPRQRIFKVIDERADYLKKYYDATLKKFSAKNIDSDIVY